MGLWMVVGGWVALLECLCECVLEGVGGSWVTCCCWLAHNISKYMTSTWLLYLVYIARLLDFFFLNFFQETGFKVLRKEKRPFRPSIPPRSCHCQ